MDLRLATLKAVSFYLLYNVSTLNQCRNFSCVTIRVFFLGGRRGTRTPKHFVNLTGESKNCKMLEFPLKKLQILSIDCFYFFRFELYNCDFLESN
jgi:hypothetical protein